jgi:hypothetical protein
VTGSTVYHQCGLRIRSELGLSLPIVDEEGFDVDLLWGPDLDDGHAEPDGDLIAWFGPSEDEWLYRAASTDHGFVIRFRDLADFVITADLSTVRVRRDPSANEGLCSVLAAGTVMAFLLTLRGVTVLHASAVAVDGRALAFVGPSGRGKSTLAALLCLDGAGLITDDVLAIDPGPPVTGIGGATELRLREAAASLADVRGDLAKRVTADQRTAVTLERSAHERLPLAAIVVPAPSRTARKVDVTRLSPSTALLSLLSSPRIHGWRRSDVLSRDFDTQSEIVNQVPVYAATIPWGPPFDASVARELSRLVQPSDVATASK